MSIGPCDVAPPRRRHRAGVVVASAGRDHVDVDADFDGGGDVEVDDDDVLDQELIASVFHPLAPRDRRPRAELFHPEPLGCDPFGCDGAAPAFVARGGVAVGAGFGEAGVFVPAVASASVGTDVGLRVGVDVVGSGGVDGFHGGVFVGPHLAASPFDGLRVDAGLAAGLGGDLDVVRPTLLVPLSVSFAAADDVDVVLGVVGGAWPVAVHGGAAPVEGPCPDDGAPVTATTTEITNRLWMAVTLGISTDVLLR